MPAQRPGSGSPLRTEDAAVLVADLASEWSTMRGMVPILPSGLQSRMEAFLGILDAWNAVHALTALPVESRFEELVLDSMALLPQLEGLPEGARVVDFGTGMGVPAIPIAMARPDLQVIALDASSKKIAFVRQVALELGLANLVPVHGRAERVAPLNAEMGTAKAVGTLKLLLGWWRLHGKEGAPFLAFCGTTSAQEKPPAGWRQEVFPYSLPNRGQRVLLRLTT